MYIIGDSNFRNTFSGKLKDLDKMGGVKSEYHSATSFTAGCKALKTITGASLVLICFLLNGIIDSCELCANNLEIESKILGVVEAYCAVIMASTATKPGVKHYVVPPFWRSTPDWLNGKLDSIAGMVRERLALNLDVFHLPPITFSAEDLTDGVHLNLRSQEKLYTHITSFMFHGLLHQLTLEPPPLILLALHKKSRRLIPRPSKHTPLLHSPIPTFNRFMHSYLLKSQTSPHPLLKSTRGSTILKNLLKDWKKGLISTTTPCASWSGSRQTRQRSQTHSSTKKI